jgi:glycosyltransferase involved in cell wall biosynthesis
MPKTVIVVPCFNEASRLVPADFRAAVSAIPGLSLLFVDDGSIDGTGPLLDSLCADDQEHQQVLHLESNEGKAEAVRLGLAQAFTGTPDFVGYFDADLATPLTELPGMLEEFAQPEIYAVFGSRVALLGRRIKRSPLRHYAGRVFATAASYILGLDVYDTQCGAKLFRNLPGVQDVFNRRFGARWIFDVEILARCQQSARTGRLAPVETGIVEYPLRQWRDVAGSKLSPREAVHAVIELVRIWLAYRPRKFRDASDAGSSSR